MARSPNPRAASPNYDQDVDDFLRDLGPLEPNNENENNAPAKDVDEEIKIRKKRLPVAKLDETRLLSDAGIPKLRSIAKKNLKFKGKGHEFSDIGRLLNMYQLWLDDLYPRAKFRDAVGMVEKVGHSKRMVVMRKAWVDGTKPHMAEDRLERGGDGNVEMSGGLGGDEDLFGEKVRAGAGEEVPRPAEAEKERDGEGDVPEEDELDALMAETTASTTAKPSQKSKPLFEEEDDDEDELDALMAENELSAPPKPSAPPAPVKTGTATQPKKSGPFEDDEDDGEPDEDELDALLSAETAGKDVAKADASGPQAASSRPMEREDEFADDEEAMAGMGW